MKHTASARFWALYAALTKAVQSLADKNFQLLKSDPRHPSLHFKRLGTVWSVRVGDHHRALGGDSANDAMAKKAQILALRVLAERLEHNETGPQAITFTLAA